MKIFTNNPPHKFKTGALLDPNRINDNMAYMLDANNDVASKRFSKSIISIPFEVDVANGYTDGYSQEVRSYRFTAVHTMWIERAFLEGQLASGTATLSVFNIATGLPPAGVVNPIFTPTTDYAQLYYGSEILIPAGTTLRFELTGTPFVVDKLDLILHIRTDRFFTGSTNVVSNPIVTNLTQADGIAAATLSTNYAAIDAAVAANSTKNTARKVMFFVANNFTNSTDVDLLRWDIPRTDANGNRQTVIGINLFAIYATTGTTSTFVSWSLQTETGGTTGVSAAAPMSGLILSGSTTVATSTLATAVPGIESDSTKDYRITVANSSAINCVKSYAYVWIA